MECRTKLRDGVKDLLLNLGLTSLVYPRTEAKGGSGKGWPGSGLFKVHLEPQRRNDINE